MNFFKSAVCLSLLLGAAACASNDGGTDSVNDELSTAAANGKLVGSFTNLGATDWAAVKVKLVRQGTSVFGGEDGGKAYETAVKSSKVLGVTGFSGQWDLSIVPTTPDQEAALTEAKKQVPAAEAGFNAIFKALPSSGLRIVSGGTRVGVPKIAHEQAAKLSLKTDAVSSGKGGDYVLDEKLGFCKVDQALFLGDDWGKESATFLAVTDEMLLVGGGGQVRKEAMSNLVSSKPLYVVLGTGGAADAIVDLVKQAQTPDGVDVKGTIFKLTAAQAANLHTYKTWAEAAAAAPTWLKNAK